VTHTQIAVSTLVGIIASGVLVVGYARWSKCRATIIDTVLISLTVGLSVLLWREAANTPVLNDDRIPLLSPNDVLCPMLTYVCLGLLVAFRARLGREDWPRLRALLTLLSLVVNAVTI
jgi:hypothetical protein